MRVVTDSYHHAFERTTKIGSLEIQRYGFAVSKDPPKRTVVSVPDDFEHEQAVVYNVKGRGLVIMTSCGHRGIVNSVRSAIRVSGINKIHAVMGGFHLAPHAPEYLRETIAGLKQFNPDFLVPMHCSGEAFITMAAQEFGPKFIRSSTGSRFVFSA